MRRIRVRLRRGTTASLLALAGLSVLALTLVSSGLAVVHLEGQPTALRDFDARATAAPTNAQLRAARMLHAHVSWSSLGTPASVIHYGGYLATGLRAPSPEAAAASWLAAHKQLFRLTSVSHLRLDTAAPLRGSHAYAVVFRQTFGGVVSADGMVTVTVASAKHGWNVVYASSSLTPDAGLTGARALTPLSAWQHAAQADRRARQCRRHDRQDRDRRLRRLRGGLQRAADSPSDRLRHAAPRSDPRLRGDGHRRDPGAQSSYLLVVDGTTGKLLSRQNLVFNFSDNPTWLAFTAAPPFNPMNAYPWNYPSTDTRQLYCWTATNGCADAVSDDPGTTVYPLGVASKFPWDVQLDSAGNDLGTTQTTGNNVDEARLWSGTHNIYGDPTLFRDQSPTRDYQPAFDERLVQRGLRPDPRQRPGEQPGRRTTSRPPRSTCSSGTTSCTTTRTTSASTSPTGTRSSTTTGSAAPANDGLLGNSQAGAATGSRDNANMSTGADGLHARTNMFLWQSLAAAFYAPCVDGDYDFGVFGHEFGHMIENRMIAKGVGARQGNAAGAMGEAFGDFDALEVMNALHIAPVPGSDRYTEGAYVTGNPYNGIRDFLAGRPMGGQFPQPGHNPDTDPLNYGDFGFDLTGPEVHADGEIWVAVQMDLRDLFLQRYPSSGADQDIACVRGRLAASDCPGDRRWIQDYYDAMVLMPRRPTMIDARDAMLAADQARFGGANQDLLWQGFAMRGFGQFQSTVDANDTDPVPDFSSPLANNATLNFSADSKSTEVPVSAKIYVGDYQARSTQIADTDPGTTGAVNLDNTAPFVPNGAGSLTATTRAGRTTTSPRSRRATESSGSG